MEPLADAGRVAASLTRHATRRAAGIPTVSALVGPAAAGRRAWRDALAGPMVAVGPAGFSWDVWLHAAAAGRDWAAAAVRSLADRAGRDPAALLAEWPNKTAADRERFWALLAPRAGDDVVRQLADGRPVAEWAAHGERAVAALLSLADPATAWPGLLFAAAARTELEAVAGPAAAVAVRFPALPGAVVVPRDAWTDYLAAAPETRAKAILREGECPVPVPAPDAVERQLAAAGLPDPVAAAGVLAAVGADAALVAAAAAVVRATTPEQPEPDAARSAAERFLFAFLESIPETAGRFELNGTLDFRFGPRPAEVDLLCRGPRVAVEIDGYFHFRDQQAYRRDRAKDYELQRRGYLVLRFLAEDVVPELETIRDRILSALTPGDPP